MVAPQFTSTSGTNGGVARVDKAVSIPPLPKIRPRSATSAHAHWREQLDDAAVKAKWLPLFDGKGRPTVSEVVVTYLHKGYSLVQLAAITIHARAEWDSINTDLYFLIRSSLDLSGTHEKDDQEFIHKTFRLSASVRDGVGLFNWIESFVDTTKLSTQSQLRLAVDTAKLSSTANLDQVETHTRELLRNWLAITTNRVAEP